MELSDGNLAAMSNYLAQTMSPDAAVRKPAEKFLESVEVNKNFPILLLQLVDKQEVDASIRTAGAIAFKNFVKRNWEVLDDAVDHIHAEDRAAIKNLIVDMMLRSPRSVQKQLSDAIYIIGRHDFPKKWPDLLSQMVEKCAAGDFHIINGVMHTAHSIFKRYRYEFKSQELWEEIRFVIDGFADPLTKLFVKTMELTKAHADNKDALSVLYSTLAIISKVFYSLNYQDLPDYFEDNMKPWMTSFHELLTVDVKCLQTDDDEVGVMEELRSQVCDNVALYARKYDEEFQPYLQMFVTDVWNLLTSTSQHTKYDLLVSNALQFLASVADRPQYSHLFEQSSVLTSICEKVIIPNMEFRECDEELFEDNPEEYIRRDIEGSDVDTRRRAACDLVKSLSRAFETQMTQIFAQYVQVMLAKYAENPEQNWRCKDSALYMVTSLAAKGQTQKSGITQTNQLVNLTDFANNHILPEINNPAVNTLPVIKADAIKYMMIFRTQLPGEMMLRILPQMVQLLQATRPVVHNYAAFTIEKILLLKAGNETPLVKSEDLAPLAPTLFTNLFALMLLPNEEENEYAMKAIMRSFSTLKDLVIPLLDDMMLKLTERLCLAARNPSKPHFNHYLFETLSLAIRIACKKTPEAVNSFEALFFPPFQNILQQDVQEFVPYVFQLLSMLLEMRPPGVPDPYMALFPCLLVPALWERPGNVSPLVRLLQAFISRGAEQIASTQNLSGLLGVFQKLIASKTNDHEGFYLLQTLIEHFPFASLEPYMKQVFVLLFQRLSSSKTTKYVKGLIVFFCFYAVKCSATRLVQMVDNIQPQMFGMVLDRVIIPDLQKVSGQMEKKLAAAGITNLLCDCPALIDGPYAQFWPPLLQSLLQLFELPEDDSLLPDDHFIEVDDTPGYQAAYSKLAFAGRPESENSLPAIAEPRIHLAQALEKLSKTYPARISTMISQSLSPDAANLISNYLKVANVQLS